MTLEKGRRVIFLFSVLFAIPLEANPKGPKDPLPLNSLPFNPSTIKRLEKGEIITHSHVETIKGGGGKKAKAGGQRRQRLHFKSAGIHSKTCSFALRKIFRYERFQDYFGFIKSSSYDREKERIDLAISTPLLPFKMRLNFKIPPITGPGITPFIFDRGLLKGLRGEIHTTPHGPRKSRCLFFSFAHWKGKHTEINDTVFEFFSQTLGQIFVEKLFRISSVL